MSTTIPHPWATGDDNYSRVNVSHTHSHIRLAVYDGPTLLTPGMARHLAATLASLADDLEEEGTQGVNRQGRTLHDAGWHDSQIVAAARIRRILATGHLDNHADEDGPTTGTDD